MADRYGTDVKMTRDELTARHEMDPPDSWYALMNRGDAVRRLVGPSFRPDFLTAGKVVRAATVSGMRSSISAFWHRASERRRR